MLVWAELGSVGSLQATGEKPNILWITAEDMSASLGCYGDPDAVTPHLDAFARTAVRYTRTFASAPVCSPSRSCLITGCLAPSMGTHAMRSAMPIPSFIHGFPSYLRQHGYETFNNVKTDYNTRDWERLEKESWTESSPEAHWRKRTRKDRPFFAVFNLMTSHQSRSMVWPREKFKAEVQSRLKPGQIHDPAKMQVPPYYPDTPEIRQTLARNADCITVMDQEVGEILRQLREDRLEDDTIVFFFSDHGTGLPRHKRALLDTGMHVPLMVRVPDKFSVLAPGDAGTTTDRLVGFVDFAPSVLSLAGVPIPEHMQGTPFLGWIEGPSRQYLSGHRDRVDEALDTARSLRDGQFLYIRNYRPQISYHQPTAWPDLGTVRHEISRLAHAETMTPAQWHYAGPTRPPEELYDSLVDPLNLTNLVNDPERSETLDRFRQMHAEQRAHDLDVGFLPESLLEALTSGTTPWEAARQNRLDLPAVHAAADEVGLGDESALVRLLLHEHPGARYWGAVGLAARESLSARAVRRLNSVLQDATPVVRVAAADALLRHGNHPEALSTLIQQLEAPSLTLVLEAARTIELLGSRARGAVAAMETLLKRCEKIRPPDTPATVVQSGDQDLAMFTAFSAAAFLKEMKSTPTGWISLFNGQDLSGWEARAEGQVEARDGCIRILAQGKNLWLVHEQEFDDFELEVEAFMPLEGYNSGIGFRCVGDTGRPKGYQCEIENQKSGMLYAIGSGWVYPRNEEENTAFQNRAGTCFRPGEWNHFRIRCEGPHLQIWINDNLTTDVQDSRFDQGRIALQHHGKGDVHLFRKIRIRKL